MTSKTALRAGQVATGLAGLFLLFDTALKLLQLPVAVETTVQLGYPAHTVFVIGVVELVCLTRYAIPRTSVLGALLLTGYLGGAVATHLRVENPLLGYTLFPLYVAALVWGGLYLRNERLRAVVPFTR